MSGGFLCLGLMSGTSMDGIDAVLARIGREGDETLVHTTLAYPHRLRQKLFAAVASPRLSLSDFGALDYAIGAAFGLAAAKCLKTARARRVRGEVDVIGSHGQTIFHEPGRKVSLQLGSPQAIAARTGITTVSNFRMADIVAGGEGAPLLPYYHLRVLGCGRPGFSVHNLGGISNFTYFGPQEKIVALDTGPANCLMDAAIHEFSHGRLKYDRQGAWALAGTVSPPLLSLLKRDPDVVRFLARPAPKSTGRELFSSELLRRALREAKRARLTKEDVLATLAQYSVDLMVLAYERFVLRPGHPLREIVLCGGGAQNRFVRERLAAALPRARIGVLEEYGLSSQALEAQAFGCFGLMCVLGRAQNLPAATGASAKVVGGEITPGANWVRLYQKVHSASAKNVSNLL